jgi:hypothetical protein
MIISYISLARKIALNEWGKELLLSILTGDIHYLPIQAREPFLLQILTGGAMTEALAVRRPALCMI